MYSWQLGFGEEIRTFLEQSLVWMAADIIIDVVFISDMGLSFFTGVHQ